MRGVVLITGVMASGKSTVAQAPAERLVVQDVVLGPDLTAYVQLVRTRPLHVVVLAPGPEAFAAREAGRAKTGYGAWTVEDLDGVLRARTPRIGLWVGSSGLTVEETVAEILAERERARVV
jgi:hypothetical protein